MLKARKKVKVAVTGAAGQIGYSLLFRLASGETFGPDVEVELNLVELAEAQAAAAGVAMELEDCAFVPLSKVNCFDDVNKGFDGVNWAVLLGSKPRGPGMERSDLLRANGPIFTAQGKALSRGASDLRVVVVGNPCNTNGLIAMKHCRDVPESSFAAMTALDENRARGMLGQKTGVDLRSISRLAIWGNHSPTMYPDLEQTLIAGKKALDLVPRDWFEKDYIPKVGKRGAEVIAARGKSSAASAASAVVDHIRRYLEVTPAGEFFSSSVSSSHGLYGIPKGLLCSVPIRSLGGGKWEVVEGLPLSAFAKARIDLSVKELLEERQMIADLLD